MDAGMISSSTVSNKTQSRYPLQEQLLQQRNSRENLNRFIPNRSAMDFDYAHFMLTEGRKGKENPSVSSSPSREAYRKHLAETFIMNRTRILAFKKNHQHPWRPFQISFHRLLIKPNLANPADTYPRLPRGH